MLNLPQDTREFVELLNSRGVKYVLLGGYAVAYHGHPRLTKDADFFIEPSLENGERVAGVLNEFGMGSIQLTAAEVAAGISVHFGRPPYRIDVLSAVDGISFEEAWESRVETVWDGVPIKIIGREPLIKNKLASGRFNDLDDAQKLQKRS